LRLFVAWVVFRRRRRYSNALISAKMSGSVSPASSLFLWLVV
jgi:hypothetical protein